MLEIIVPAQLQLSAEEKLDLLSRLDRWRRWRSLNDRRLCLGCGRIITGHDIEVVQPGTDGPMEVHCPTPECQSIPLDWILPNSRDRETQQ